MPLDFLTVEQARRYGRYQGFPNQAQLERYFHLDEHDVSILAKRVRGGTNRLGFALQLTTVRFLGTFLPDPLEVPDNVLAYLTVQLSLQVAPAQLGRYRRGETRWDHQSEICRQYGYKDFTGTAEQLGLLRYLYARSWVNDDSPSLLFDAATARLVERKTLLPGATVLARLVNRVRERVLGRVYKVLNRTLSVSRHLALEALLEVPAGSRFSRLELLRKPPTSSTAGGLVGVLERLERVRSVDVKGVDLSIVPPQRLEALALHGKKAKAQTLRQTGAGRRVATLLATVQHLEGEALDQAVTVFDQLMQALTNRVERERQEERLRELLSLDAAARTLREAVLQLVDESHSDLGALREAVYQQTPRAHLLTAAEAVDRMTRAPDEVRAEELLKRYAYIRQFLPQLLSTVAFSATPAGQDVLQAWYALARLEGRKRTRVDEVPQGVVRGSWRSMVVDKDGVLQRPAYTLCVLEALQAALKRRDIFVPGSHSYRDPRTQLLSGVAWQAVRVSVLRSFDLDADPEVYLARLGERLDARYREVAGRLANNPHARLTTLLGKRGGLEKEAFELDALDALPEPESLKALRHEVAVRLPQVELTEVLLEVYSWTGALADFTHVSEARPRLDDLATSVCAVLIADACNIGLEPVARSALAPLTRSRLSHVDQNYVRAETLAAANAKLVDFQAILPLAQTWGGGHLASVDGMRFRVPVKTIHAGPNPKYFGVGKGVTYLNWVSDQATGFHAIVVPGTLRDSLYALDGLLEQETGLRPTQITSDTHAYTDIVFGLFYLLGYQFSPRLARLRDRRLWRLDKDADYGRLNGISKRKIAEGRIVAHWEDIVRVVGSLSTGAVRASDLLRVLHGDGEPSSLGKAISEVGRLAKSLHLLKYVDDEVYRREILGQLNLHEERHSLAARVCYGRKGELYQRYRDGLEDQIGALGFVLNAIALWNTRYIELALAHLRDSGFEVRDEDVARLSPLRSAHINVLGRYSFELPEFVRLGALRELHQPSAFDV